MKLKKNLNLRESWDVGKTIPQNIANILCGSSKDADHQHSQDCFNNFGSKEEKDALEILLSEKARKTEGNAYLFRVVEPILEVLPSHNGSEPSLLYSLLQYALRLYTDGLGDKVEHDKTSIRHQIEKISKLSERAGVNNELDSISIKQAILDKEEEFEALKIKHEAIKGSIHATSVRISRLPQPVALSEMLSKKDAQVLKDAFNSRLNTELELKQGESSDLISQLQSQADELVVKRNGNREAHGTLDRMKAILSTVHRYAVKAKINLASVKKMPMRFFSEGTKVIVSKKVTEKDFIWNGKKGVCENLKDLLSKYNNTSGHSSDRRESAERIYRKVNALLENNSLNSMQRGARILAEIRKENIASRGRWTGVESQLFAIYRSAEFAHREHLRNYTKNVSGPELQNLIEKEEDIIKLNQLSKDVADLKNLLELSQKTLGRLREQELNLVLNAEDRSGDDDTKLMADEEFKKNQQNLMSDLEIAEESVNIYKNKSSRNQRQLSDLDADIQEMNNSIDVVYKRLCETTKKIHDQGRADLAPLSEGDIWFEAQKLEKAEAYLNSLEAEIKARENPDSQSQPRPVFFKV